MRGIGMVIIIAASVVACSDSTEPAVINGTYSLQRARGEALPAVLREGTDYALKVTAGTITLNGDLTFTDSYSFWEYIGGAVTTATVPCTGTWTPTSQRFFTLQEAGTPGCGQGGTGEWDGRNHVTVAWNTMGTMVHGR